MRKLAICSIAASLVREEEGACLGAVACGVRQLISLAHDGLERQCVGIGLVSTRY